MLFTFTLFAYACDTSSSGDLLAISRLPRQIYWSFQRVMNQVCDREEVAP